MSACHRLWVNVSRETSSSLRCFADELSNGVTYLPGISLNHMTTCVKEDRGEIRVSVQRRLYLPLWGSERNNPIIFCVEKKNGWF